MEKSVKRSLRAELDAETASRFDSVKHAFGIQTDSEAVRLCITLTAKNLKKAAV